MKLIEIVSHPAFILSANAGNMYKSILSVVTTLTGVTVPTLEVHHVGDANNLYIYWTTSLGDPAV